jgi:hypothetical protein
MGGKPMFKVASALAGAVVFMSPAATVAQGAPLVIGGQSGPVLRAGTSVPLKTVTALTTNGKQLKVGQRFELEVSEPVTVAGQTVIPVGSRAMGEVTDVRNKGMWGKSGRINARVLYVLVGGRQIRLSGQLDDKGTTGTAGVVASVALVPVVGFFVTGTSANIPVGTSVAAYIDEDVPVAFAGSATPAPLIIQAQPVAFAPTTTQPVAVGPATPARITGPSNPATIVPATTTPKG